jgi:hypothetical protein
MPVPIARYYAPFDPNNFIRFGIDIWIGSSP